MDFQVTWTIMYLSDYTMSRVRFLLTVDTKTTPLPSFLVSPHFH